MTTSILALGHCQWDSYLTHLLHFTYLFFFQAEGHQEPSNEVGSESLEFRCNIATLPKKTSLYFTKYAGLIFVFFSPSSKLRMTTKLCNTTPNYVMHTKLKCESLQIIRMTYYDNHQTCRILIKFIFFKFPTYNDLSIYFTEIILPQSATFRDMFTRKILYRGNSI